MAPPPAGPSAEPPLCRYGRGQRYNTICTVIAKFHYPWTRTRARHGPDTDKVRARCRVRAKFHHTDTDTDADFFAAKLRWVRAGPFGSVSVSV